MQYLRLGIYKGNFKSNVHSTAAISKYTYMEKFQIKNQSVELSFLSTTILYFAWNLFSCICVKV